jgi:ribonuclease BN (tRNA processing enzyme)
MVAMAAAKDVKPRGLTIRAYDVGFGDCFLLIFDYPRGPRHVLIDFGSTAAARKGVPLDMTIAENIAQVTGGKLHAVVVTHRHADHVSGFTTRNGTGPGDIIRKCARDAVIVQPWTEDPKLAPKATAPKRSSTDAKSLAVAQLRSLEAMHEVAAIIARRAGKIDVSEVDPEQQGEESSPGQVAAVLRPIKPAAPTLAMGKDTRERLRFLGETNLKNLSAVKNLMTMSSSRKRHYVYFGTRSGLDNVLPGVKVDVLGPPTVEQSKDVLKERRDDQAEFWMLAAAATKMTTSANKPLFSDEEFVSGNKAPRTARWFIRRMRAIHAEQLFELVRIVDDAMNNTSAILLFTIGDTRLLFPGDAQIENWQYALKASDQSEQILKKLAEVNVYKVGHHGSRNATPKTLWRTFKNRRKGLKTIMSTKSGKFPGRPGSGTEVPRETLKNALRTETNLTNTQDLRGTKKDYFVDVDVPLH